MSTEPTSTELPPEIPRYEISSFQDIIEKVPPDRIPVMLSELGEMLADMAQLRNLSLACLADASMDLPADAITVKLPLVWKDDNQGKHTITLVADEEKIATVRSSPMTPAEVELHI